VTDVPAGSLERRADPPPRPMKVLIAEDQAAIRRWLTGLVERWGYDVVAVGDGEAAWEVLQAPDGPQLAILDWMMPRMDGQELCKRIRQNPQETYIYVIMLTGKDAREDIVRGLEAGADDYVIKRLAPDNSDLAELKARLNTGRRIIELQAELLKANKALEKANEALTIQATHDGLTSLWNRSAIIELLEREWSDARRQVKPLGVVIADLDHFKRINDTHGHLAGDTVLRSAARHMQSVSRPSDLIGRYGGEEFLLVLPGCALPNLVPLAERLRQAVCDLSIDFGGERIPVTVSMGGTSADPAWSGSLAALLHAADEALYRAKAAGRNCVQVALPE
jgi:two-component system, cell cycle response regulator